MIYLLIAVSVVAHYWMEYRKVLQRDNEDSMHFALEMSKTHPVFVHPLEEK